MIRTIEVLFNLGMLAVFVVTPRVNQTIAWWVATCGGTLAAWLVFDWLKDKDPKSWR